MPSTHHSHSRHYDSTLMDISIWSQFCVQFGHITAQFLFLTIKFGKIKWRFSSCNCFNFSFSSLCSLWHFALSCSSYMWTSVQCGFLVIHTFCILCCMGWTPWGHVTRTLMMHFWNDVITGLDSGLLTIGAKALSKPMPIYCLHTHRIKVQTS